MSPLWIVLTLLPILGGAERFNCRGRILGAYYADAKSGCKAFHVCVNVAGGGIRDFRFYCPPGTLFHQEAQTCTDWGDDDPLACPADIYDGQFDLYKIGSGFDTRKLSHENRDDEAEFGLQRAETGDRRLSQNNGESNAISSDLRAAHSSDFFSGQRDRGRDDPLPPAPNAQLNAQPVISPVSSSRQSFRRATTSRPKPTTTQYTTNNSPTQYPTSLPSKPNRYNQAPKRKLTRKRPIYTTTQSPTTFASNTFSPQVYSEQPQNYNRRIPSQNTQDLASTVNVPPQYKDEYVEVSRVTPKPIRYFSNSPSSTPSTQPLGEPQPNKKSGLAEEYKYDTQSTSGIKAQNENRPFKVRNSFSVIPDVPNENDFLRSQSFNRERGTPTTTDFSTTTRGFLTSTSAYRNVNSISYEQEKNNYNQFPSSKQNYFYSPTTTPSTIATAYTTTTRYESPQSLNTIAYNTNNAFSAQSSNFADSNEDDGQYRPPEGEDDGQYRPELYERELLSGAHSLNIAASGNRLLEDQKAERKHQFSRKPGAGASVPRPFRPAPSVATSTQLSIIPEITYSTTLRPIPEITQRTFDYYQTYTTTSRPFEPKPPGTANNNAPSYDSTPARITSTSVPRTYDPQRSQNRETPQPTNAPAPAPRPTHRPHHFAKPAHNKEDTSYDYAYYDSDSGFSEYDQIEEFGRTNTKG